MIVAKQSRKEEKFIPPTNLIDPLFNLFPLLALIVMIHQLRNGYCNNFKTGSTLTPPIKIQHFILIATTGRE